MSRKRHTYRWWTGGQKGVGTYAQESFATKAEKDEFVAEIRRRRRLGLPLVIDPAPLDPTLSEFIEEYWRVHAMPNLEDATRAKYRQQWRKWVQPRLGDLQLSAITPRVVNRQLVESMRAKGAQDPTVRSALGVLQSVLALAEAEELIAVNPVARVRKPAADSVREVEAIAPLRVEMIRAQLEDLRDRTMVSVLAYRGLRPEELLALRVEDLLHAGERVGRKNVDGKILGYTKTHKDRTVTKGPPQARQDLREYMIATGIRSGLLFPRADGEPWRKHDWDNWRDRVYRPALIAAGWPVDVTRTYTRRRRLPDGTEKITKRKVETTSAIPYDLRGSFVSLLAWEGHTMLEVSRQAGHTVQTCERHYARVFEDVDPAKRTTAEEAVRAAREQLAAGGAQPAASN